MKGCPRLICSRAADRRSPRPPSWSPTRTGAWKGIRRGATPTTTARILPCANMPRPGMRRIRSSSSSMPPFERAIWRVESSRWNGRPSRSPAISSSPCSINLRVKRNGIAGPPGVPWLKKSRLEGYYFTALVSPSTGRVIDWIRVQENDCFRKVRLSKSVQVQSSQAAPVLAPAPASFRLGANYPNPFNPGTTIPYTLSAENEVTLTIMDLMGHPVRSLFSGRRSAGEHSAVWDGTDERGQRAPGGIYFCVLNLGRSGAQARKILLLK